MKSIDIIAGGVIFRKRHTRAKCRQYLRGSNTIEKLKSVDINPGGAIVQAKRDRD